MIDLLTLTSFCATAQIDPRCFSSLIESNGPTSTRPSQSTGLRRDIYSVKKFAKALCTQLLLSHTLNLELSLFHSG
ncbi:hypothetical protein CJU89_3769 [Yarrowia sp. B02]|nr:hypothetical protein CJU89_3769 [Yarrowia sp. B02]